MPDPVAKALKRKEELEHRIGQLESELQQIKIFLSMHSRFSGTEPEYHETVNSPPRDDSTGQFTRERGRPKEIARFIMAILEDKRRPMTRTQLVDELEARGHSIPAQDKARYVGTVLWRHDRAFINLPNMGYWLRAKALEAANYAPDPNDPLLKPAYLF